MKLNFNKPARDLDGKAIKDESGESLALGKLLAGALVGKVENISPLKAYELALKLNKGEAVELDSVDSDALEVFIKTIQTLSVLVTGQLLEIMQEAKSQKVKK